MDLEKECQLRMEEKFYLTEGKKVDGNLLYPMKFLENNLRRRDLLLKKKKDITDVFLKGSIFYSSHLKFCYKKNNMMVFRFLATAPRNWGKAHERNRFKRVIKEILWGEYLNLKIPKNWDLIIMPKFSLQKSYKGTFLKEEIKNFINKLKFMR